MNTRSSKVREIFDQAAEIAAESERLTFLDAACAGDTELRGEVDALLQAYGDAGSFLDRPALDMAALGQSGQTEAFDGTSAPAGSDPTATRVNSAAQRDDDPLVFLSPSAKPGHLGRLGHYEILEVIGKGGFGTVLRAFDEKLHRVSAIKVLSPAYAANGSARTRFIREARTAAAVKNDHVVAVYSVQDEADPPYLVMELIDGVSLQEKLDKKGPLTLKEILRIGMQMAEGLAAAHKQGLVHRDIKPANILLENGVERVKITDFGLARAVDDASVTQSGTVAGTPMYMSPEQAEGLPIDHRSDLFSLGTVLYAMCTGHPPFRASGTHAVLKRVIDASPRPIREINNEIPDWLCDIIAKLHAKKPEDRFQTASEVAELLGQHLAHSQQPASTPAPAPLVPAALGAPCWQVGDRVLAPWEPEWLYPATVQLANEVCVLVSYDDGDTEWVQSAEVRPLDIEKGSRVFVWWNGLYYPGTATERKSDQVHIAYDDGDSEWTVLNCIRVSAAPPETPMSPAPATGSATQRYGAPGAMPKQWFLGFWVPTLVWAGMGAAAAYQVEQVHPGCLLLWYGETPHWLDIACSTALGACFGFLALMVFWGVFVSWIQNDAKKRVAFLPGGPGWNELPNANQRLFLGAASWAWVALMILAVIVLLAALFNVRGRVLLLVTAGLFTASAVFVAWRYHRIRLTHLWTPLSYWMASFFGLAAACFFGLWFASFQFPNPAILMVETDGADVQLKLFNEQDGTTERILGGETIVAPGFYRVDFRCDATHRIGSVSITDGNHTREVSKDGFQVKFSRGDRLVVTIRVLPLEAREPGWVPLFNGKDLSGWKAHDANAWKIENGHIVGTDGHLQLNKLLGDFHCRLELKMSGMGDIAFRGIKDHWAAAAVGDLWPAQKTGSLIYFEDGQIHALVDHQNDAFTAEKWFTLEIIAQGKKATIKINGVTTAEKTIERMLDQGILDLRVDSKRGRLEVRKIEIKELPPIPMQKQAISPKA